MLFLPVDVVLDKQGPRSNFEIGGGGGAPLVTR